MQLDLPSKETKKEEPAISKKVTFEMPDLKNFSQVTIQVGSITPIEKELDAKPIYVLSSQPPLKANAVSQHYTNQLNLEGFEDLDLELRTAVGSGSNEGTVTKSTANTTQSLVHSKSVFPNINRTHSMNSSILTHDFNGHVNSMHIKELDE